MNITKNERYAILQNQLYAKRGINFKARMDYPREAFWLKECFARYLGVVATYHPETVNGKKEWANVGVYALEVNKDRKEKIEFCEPRLVENSRQAVPDGLHKRLSEALKRKIPTALNFPEVFNIEEELKKEPTHDPDLAQALLEFRFGHRMEFVFNSIWYNDYFLFGLGVEFSIAQHEPQNPLILQMGVRKHQDDIVEVVIFDKFIYDKKIDISAEYDVCVFKLPERTEVPDDILERIYLRFKWFIEKYADGPFKHHEGIQLPVPGALPVTPISITQNNTNISGDHSIVQLGSPGARATQIRLTIGDKIFGLVGGALGWLLSIHLKSFFDRIGWVVFSVVIGFLIGYFIFWIWPKFLSQGSKLLSWFKRLWSKFCCSCD